MSPVLAGIAGVLVGLALYALTCLSMPFVMCRKCAGAGKVQSRSGRVSRPCKRCKESGRRLRLGRKVINYLRDNRDRADRATR